MLCSHYAFDIFTLNIIKIKKRGGRMDKKENTVVLFPQLSERYIDEGF